MSDAQSCLADGKYPCQATLHIKDGEAVVELHDMFGLAIGTAIPLLRKDGNLLVEQLLGGSVDLKNGHAII